ncbi:MAG: purine-nucleoside phosphorylase [Planctomycetes bacterium]|nr:purine-nucleoside phosphorylase [Planctomycetota bacterium]
MSETSKIAAAADYVRQNGWNQARIGLVLGSGLKNFGRHVQVPTELAFTDVPEWPAPRVEGHGGSVLFGSISGVPVACLTGRVHLYEGWSPNEVVRALRTLRILGVRTFLLTNAAGGIRSDMAAGDLMLLRDHLNMTARSPLVGEHEPELGPRFPDQTAIYTPKLRNRLRSLDERVHEGVYAGMLGPSYETPAEVAMLARLGADAVGMSTVLEAIALNAMGADVAAISLISNLAAGISDQPLSHAEVIEAGRHAEERLTQLVTSFCYTTANA